MEELPSLKLRLDCNRGLDEVNRASPLSVQGDPEGESWHDQVLIVGELITTVGNRRSSPDTSTEVQHLEAGSNIKVFGCFVSTLYPQVETER